jgi:hypothetical protein
MAAYARVEGNEVVERREMADPPPAHKASLWRPVVIEGSGPRESVVIEADQVRIVRSDIELDDLKSSLKRRIDDDAEACRGRFLTLGSGQAMTYLEKHNQAVAVHDMGEAAANAMSEADRRATFPTLAASVGVEAPTLWECSQIVLARYLVFVNASFVIEQTKLVNKKLVSLASDTAAGRAVYEAITWPTP